MENSKFYKVIYIAMLAMLGVLVVLYIIEWLDRRKLRKQEAELLQRQADYMDAAEARLIDAEPAKPTGRTVELNPTAEVSTTESVKEEV